MRLLVGSVIPHTYSVTMDKIYGRDDGILYVPKIPKYLKLLQPKFNQHICTYLLITSFTWSLQLKIFNRINTAVNLHVHKKYTGTTSPNYRIYSVRGRFSSGQHDTFYTETAVHLRQVLGYFPNEY